MLLPRDLDDAPVASDPADGLSEGRPEAFRAVYDAELEHVMMLLSQGFLVRKKAGGRSRVRIADPFDVEELTQEAFARFFGQCVAGRFDARRPVRPYLRRIAMNVALEFVAKRYREDLVDAEVVDAMPAEPGPARLEDAECARLVAEFRGELGADDQAILDLYYADTRPSQADVGAKVGLSRDQVYRALTRIRAEARAFFSDKGWFE